MYITKFLSLALTHLALFYTANFAESHNIFARIYGKQDYVENTKQIIGKYTDDIVVCNVTIDCVICLDDLPIANKTSLDLANLSISIREFCNVNVLNSYFIHPSKKISVPDKKYCYLIKSNYSDNQQFTFNQHFLFDICNSNNEKLGRIIIIFPPDIKIRHYSTGVVELLMSGIISDGSMAILESNSNINNIYRLPISPTDPEGPDGSVYAAARVVTSMHPDNHYRVFIHSFFNINSISKDISFHTKYLANLYFLKNNQHYGFFKPGSFQNMFTNRFDYHDYYHSSGKWIPPSKRGISTSLSNSANLNVYFMVLPERAIDGSLSYCGCEKPDWHSQIYKATKSKDSYYTNISHPLRSGPAIICACVSSNGSSSQCKNPGDFTSFVETVLLIGDPFAYASVDPFGVVSIFRSGWVSAASGFSLVPSFFGTCERGMKYIKYPTLSRAAIYPLDPGLYAYLSDQLKPISLVDSTAASSLGPRDGTPVGSQDHKAENGKGQYLDFSVGVNFNGMFKKVSTVEDTLNATPYKYVSSTAQADMYTATSTFGRLGAPHAPPPPQLNHQGPLADLVSETADVVGYLDDSGELRAYAPDYALGDSGNPAGQAALNGPSAKAARSAMPRSLLGFTRHFRERVYHGSQTHVTFQPDFSLGDGNAISLHDGVMLPHFHFGGNLPFMVCQCFNNSQTSCAAPSDFVFNLGVVTPNPLYGSFTQIHLDLDRAIFVAFVADGHAPEEAFFKIAPLDHSQGLIVRATRRSLRRLPGGALAWELASEPLQLSLSTPYSLHFYLPPNQDPKRKSPPTVETKIDFFGAGWLYKSEPSKFNLKETNSVARNFDKTKYIVKVSAQATDKDELQEKNALTLDKFTGGMFRSPEDPIVAQLLSYSQEILGNFVSLVDIPRRHRPLHVERAGESANIGKNVQSRNVPAMDDPKWQYLSAFVTPGYHSGQLLFGAQGQDLHLQLRGTGLVFYNAGAVALSKDLSLRCSSVGPRLQALLRSNAYNARDVYKAQAARNDDPASLSSHKVQRGVYFSNKLVAVSPDAITFKFSERIELGLYKVFSIIAERPVHVGYVRIEESPPVVLDVPPLEDLQVLVAFSNVYVHSGGTLILFKLPGSSNVSGDFTFPVLTRSFNRTFQKFISLTIYNDTDSYDYLVVLTPKELLLYTSNLEFLNSINVDCPLPNALLLGHESSSVYLSPKIYLICSPNQMFSYNISGKIIISLYSNYKLDLKLEQTSLAIDEAHSKTATATATGHSASIRRIDALAAHFFRTKRITNVSKIKNFYMHDISMKLEKAHMFILDFESRGIFLGPPGRLRFINCEDLNICEYKRLQHFFLPQNLVQKHFRSIVFAEAAHILLLYTPFLSHIRALIFDAKTLQLIGNKRSELFEPVISVHMDYPNFSYVTLGHGRNRGVPRPHLLLKSPGLGAFKSHVAHYTTGNQIINMGEACRFEPVTEQPVNSFRWINAKDYSSCGLNLDEQTGVISGTPSCAGQVRMKIRAINFFGDSMLVFKFFVTCSTGFLIRSGTNGYECGTCELGFFYNAVTKSCLTCSHSLANSTTDSKLSYNRSFCLCKPGFYLKNKQCVPCERGTFKSVLGNNSCYGVCPLNKQSSVRGASTLAELNCKCKPGYYLPAGEATPAESPCLPCEQGFYCPGGDKPKAPCMDTTSTIGTGSSSPKECVCKPGYQMNDRTNKCEPCHKKSYKKDFGNFKCTLCPANSRDIKSLVVTPGLGSTSVEQCRFCGLGFYSNNQRQCLPCTVGSFCRMGILLCGPNTTTRGYSSSSPIDCLCDRGYGYLPGSRNRIFLLPKCGKCKHGTFQHLKGSDSTCLPCPAGSTTLFEGSASLADCITLPGFYRFVTSKSERISALEAAYNPATDPRLGLSCFNVTEHEAGVGEAPYSFTIYRPSLESCLQECMLNVYCTRVTFSKRFRIPQILVRGFANAEAFDMPYWPCTLEYFGDLPDAYNPSGDINLSSDIPEGSSLTCSVNRTAFWAAVNFLPCKKDHYCPGEDQMIPCPTNSVTTGRGMSGPSDCKCLPGFQRSAVYSENRCVPCPIGYYKEDVSNSPCVPCGENLTTTAVGASSAADCTCTPSFFALSSSAPSSAASGFGGALSPRAANASSHSRSDKVSCAPCPSTYYCPGYWIKGLGGVSMTHMPPQPCPSNSAIADVDMGDLVINKCRCFPGYSVVSSMFGIFSCKKCPRGSFKAGHSNSPCSSSCPTFSTAYPGATHESQCFCQYNTYMTIAYYNEGNDAADNTNSGFAGVVRNGASRRRSRGYRLECAPCPKGAICPGGFAMATVDARESSPAGVLEGVEGEGQFSNSRERAIDSGAADGFNFEGHYASESEYESAFTRVIQRHSRPLARYGHFPIYTLDLRHSSMQAHQRAFVEYKSFISPRDFDYRIDPYMQPCPFPNRCPGLLGPVCSNGARGYLCSICVEKHDAFYYGDSCSPCLGLLGELLALILPRLFTLCLVIAFISHVGLVGLKEPTMSAPLLKIWLYYAISVIPFGMLTGTSLSTLRHFSQAYRLVFYPFIWLFGANVRTACLLSPLSRLLLRRYPTRDPWVVSWYLQRVLNLTALPVDFMFIALFCVLYFVFFRLARFSKFSKRGGGQGGNGEEENGKQEDALLCASLEGDSATNISLSRTLFMAAAILLYLHTPGLLLNATMLLHCVSTEMAEGASVDVLFAIPAVVCDPSDPLFALGRALGRAVLISCGVYWASVTLILFTYNRGVMASFHSSMYRVRYWDLVLQLRMAASVYLVSAPVFLDPAGESERIRSTINLICSTLFLVLHMYNRPFLVSCVDMINSVCTLCFTANLVTCILFHGSYFYNLRYAATFPIIASIYCHFSIARCFFIEYMNRRRIASILAIPGARVTSAGWSFYALTCLSYHAMHSEASLYFDYRSHSLLVEPGYYATSEEWEWELSRYRRGAEPAGRRSLGASHLDSLLASISESSLLIAIGRHGILMPHSMQFFIVRYAYWHSFTSKLCRKHLTFPEARASAYIFTRLFYPRKNCPHKIYDIGDICATGVSSRTVASVLDEFRAICSAGNWQTGNYANNLPWNSNDMEKANKVDCQLVQLLFCEIIYDCHALSLTELDNAISSLKRLSLKRVVRIAKLYSIYVFSLRNHKMWELLLENARIEREIAQRVQALRDSDSIMDPDQLIQTLDMFSSIEMWEQDIASLESIISKKKVFISKTQHAAKLAMSICTDGEKLSTSSLSDDEILAAIHHSRKTV